MTEGQKDRKVRSSIRRHVVAGLALCVMLTLGLAGWAATTAISGAIIAPGTLVVQTNVKKVQHPTGGIVGEVRVRDGDRVQAGDVLVRLDDTVTRANLAIVTKNLDELHARQARLEAERDGLEAVVFPEELTGRTGDRQAAKVMHGEHKLFEVRRGARLGQKEQFRKRIDQLREQLNGLEQQQMAKAREFTLIQRELEGANRLWSQKLMPITKLTALQREATRIEGERGQLTASLAQTKDKIAETELQIIQVDKELASEVGKDLREAEAKIGELVERRITAQDQLKRIDIRAPYSGLVHQLSVHTVGGIIPTGGEPLMLIVPENDTLAVEAKVAPQDVDQLKPGQSSRVRLSAFNFATTPELPGTVTHVSADTSIDPHSGQSYYVVRVALEPESLLRLADLKLIPGMPTEVFFPSADRTVLSFLVKPLEDQISRAFREE